MDIYSFINSCDIAKHCREIEHKFTPLEQAVIIYHSRKPLAVRHKAWWEIIDTQSDMKIVEEVRIGRVGRVFHDSLHEFLKAYMEMENRLVTSFKEREPNAFYTYKVKYIYDNPTDIQLCNRLHHDTTPHSTMEAVINAIKKDSEEDYSNWAIWKDKSYSVYKQIIDTTTCFSMDIEPTGEIMSFDIEAGDVLEEDEYDLFHTFFDINIYIPVPFEKGDILTYRHSGRPFVLETDEWKYGKERYPEQKCFLADGCIMDTIYSIDIGDNGNVFSDFNPATLELEFYRGELTGVSRILTPISNHLKGKISAVLMMNAYDIILKEERLKDRQDDMRWYTEEGCLLAGIKREFK